MRGDRQQQYQDNIHDVYDFEKDGYSSLDNLLMKGTTCRNVDNKELKVYANIYSGTFVFHT